MASRRKFLAAVTTALSGTVAGCFSDGDSSLRMNLMSSNADIGREATREISQDHNSVYVDIVSEIVSGGKTVEDSSPPIDPDRPIEFEEQVYKLRLRRGETGKQGYQIVFEPANEETEGDEIAFEELPEVDRKALQSHRQRILSEDGDTSPYDGILVYETDEIGSSELVSQQSSDIVRIDDIRYRVQISETDLKSFTYTAERIASSLEVFGEQLRNEYQFELSGLSSDEQDIVEDATDDYYYADSNDSTFERVIKKFIGHDRPTDETPPTWLVSWDGSTYWADVVLASHPDLSDQIEN